MLRQTALVIARSQVGQEENPRGSNWGLPVQAYLASVDIRFPASWCMAFVYWCFDKAAKQRGVVNPLFKTGGVLLQWEKRRMMAKTDEPVEGAIFIMDFGKGLGHTGIVDHVDGEFIYTIEGNSNDEGSREGYEVCRRIRKKASIKGYLSF
jgi:hypothetical protein